MRKLLRQAYCILPFLLPAMPMAAQLGGLHTYEFLNLTASARITGLGGNLITVRDDDSNLALANPAALNPAMHQQLNFNHSFHVAGINHGYASYAHHFGPSGFTGHAGVQYVSYGTFEETDERGDVLGTFDAGEYAITAGLGKQVAERLAVGANIRAITSQMAQYGSFGLGADVAATYFDTASNITATLLFRNMGRQLNYYTERNPEPLPFEIQFGVSKRLRYLPFRFSVIYRYLDRWNIRYDDPDAEPSVLFFGEQQPGESQASIWFDNLFRHLIFNGEFLLGAQENFRVRFGYSHLTRRELSVDNFGSLSGFSFGVGFKIKRFRFDYGHRAFHLAGGLNHFSVSTNLGEFLKKG